MIPLTLLARESDNEQNSSARIVEVSQTDQSFVQGKIAVQYSLSSTVVVAGQAIIVSYQVESNDAFISLRTDYDIKKGEEFIVLKTLKQTLSPTSNRRYRYTLKAFFSTVRSGEVDFKVPDLVYSEGGSDTYRIRFAAQAIQVESLPPYLPPYIALSDIKIDSSLSETPSWFSPFFTGRVYYWDIVLKSRNGSLQSMPEISSQISSNSQIQFLPAEIIRETAKNHDEVVQKMSYNIPFKVKANGQIALPRIRLQYFDPVQKRLIIKQYVASEIFSLNQYVYWLVLIICSIGVIYFIYMMKIYGYQIYKSLKALNHGRRQLRQATNAQQIRTGMKVFGKSLGWSGNISLKEWGGHWRNAMGAGYGIDEDLHLLAKELYGPLNDHETLMIADKIINSSYVLQCWCCLRSVFDEN